MPARLPARLLGVALPLLLTGCAGTEAGTSPGPGAPGADPLACPQAVELQDAVPVVEPVPPSLPLSVTAARTCRYGPDGTLRQDLPLDPAGLGERLLLPRAFPGQAPACAPDPAAVPLLLALQTASGPLQVGTADDPAGCAPTRVGALESAVHLGDPASPADPDAGERCGPGRPGRSGQEAALVPSGASALVLCRVDGRGVTRRTGSAEDLALVEQVLSEPVAQPSGSAPPCTPEVEGELHLSWGQGPPVLLRLRPGCTPEVDNGSLAADLPPDALARLVALLPA